MDQIVLALITSYLDAKQKRRDWRIPKTRGGLAMVVMDFYYPVSPSTRGHALNGLDPRFTYNATS